ncbi:MAG: helix-turn-helix domain-containing protein [Mycobacterium sp.]|nr:helix-turn-helix domain-containing protein [Mycobacterium sp.]
MATMTKALKKGTILPPEDLGELLDLSKFLEQHEHPAALLGPDGEQIPLPMEVYEVLKSVVAAMGRRRGVTIAPVDQLLTTQDAADLLGVSRPTVIKLIDQGKLKCDTPSGSRHRRLRLAEVLDYQKRRKSERDEALTQLVRDAEEDNLYDLSHETLAAAVKEARKARAGRGGTNG